MTTAFIALRSRSAQAWGEHDIALAQDTLARSGRELGAMFRPYGRSEDGATYVFEAHCEAADVEALRRSLARSAEFARVYAVSDPVAKPQGPFVFD